MKEIQNMNIKQMLKNQRVKDRVGMIQQSSVGVMNLLKKPTMQTALLTQLKILNRKRWTHKNNIFVESGVI